jgi:hypothetical protein
LDLYASTEPKDHALPLLLCLLRQLSFPHVPGYGSFRVTFLLQKGNFRSTFFSFSIVTVFKITKPTRQEDEFQQKVNSKRDKAEDKG